jgi:hypothetical protein
MMWMRCTKRGLGTVAVFFGTVAMLGLVEGSKPPISDCINSVVYIDALHRVVHFASLMMGAIFFAWRQAVDPIPLPWKIVRRSPTDVI